MNTHKLQMDKTKTTPKILTLITNHLKNMITRNLK